MKRVLFVSFLLLLSIITVSAQQKYPSPVTSQSIGTNYGAWYRYTYTYTGRNDTVHFQFFPNGVFSHNLLNDSSAYVFDITTVAPTDSSNVKWEIRTASDTSRAWTTGALRQDSSATAATTVTQYDLSRTQFKFWRPYMELRAIGMSPSGGKSNKVGVIVQVDLLKYN